MTRKVIDSIWFSQFGLPACIGIVITEDEETHERPVFIGMARGWNQQDDEQHIIQNGAKVESYMVAKLHRFLNKEGE